MRGTVNSHRLWYKNSAKNWNEASPIGNGRIGGMVYGGAKKEQIDLNEDTLWSGIPHEAKGEYSHIYKKAQELVLNGKNREAQTLLEDEFGENLVQMYLPLGTLNLEMEHSDNITDYFRELRLDTATHKVSYKADGVSFERKALVSAPHQVLVLNIKAKKKEAVSFSVSLNGALPNESYIAKNTQYIEGNCPVCKAKTKGHHGHPEAKFYGEKPEDKGVGYKGGIYVENIGGNVSYQNEKITVKNADSATIYFAVRTSFNGPFNHPVLNPREYKLSIENDLKSAVSLGFGEIEKQSIADHKSLYDRTELDLGESEISCLPTDERLNLHHEGKPDNSLYSLLFHFGRYLTIAGSRKGTQAMNLQGIWNAELIPPGLLTIQ